MMPRLKPQPLHISDATVRSRLSETAPYWPCIRTLNISTIKQGRTRRYSEWRSDLPGLARMAFAAPAIAPAIAISFRERSGNGDIMRFETP